MVKLNNKGFSLVEIIIAAAIFAILVYPISTALMTATKTTTTSTKKQYAVEKAEEIMENFKTATLADEVPIPDDNGVKAYSFQKSATTPKSVALNDSSSTVVDYTDTTYACDDISIGQSYEKYTCTVDVNDAAYQVMKKGYVLTDLASGSVKKNASGVVQTNVSESGTIRNLDDNQSAIIIGATYNTAAKGRNLDNMAYQYFLDAKVELLRGYEVQYNHYLSGAGTFDEDHFQKNTIIKITKLGSTYTVKCTVEYTDYTNVAVIRSDYASSGKNVYKPTTKYGDGVVYMKEFTNGLPPIYLLYVPAIYNGAYCTTDNITIDNSSISEDAKVYVFETTAEMGDTYKDIIKEQFKVSDVDDLTYINTSKNTKMSDVKVRCKLATGADRDKLKVYANFDFDNSNPDDYAVQRLTEDESGAVYMYSITVTLTDSKGNKTTVTGTRGK